tara:strand:- start:19 stop:1815 length:1797 start_codon:yes stop_codon:yes gene_type:complete
MNYKTIPEMFFSVVNQNPDKNILNFKSDNKWIPIKGSEVLELVSSLSGGLLSLGLNKQDKVAILSNTSYKWALCDYGILCCGMTTVTVYPTLIEDVVNFIINDSETRLIFVEDKLQFEKINKIFNTCEHLKSIVIMNNDDVADSYDYAYKYDDFITIGRNYVNKSNISIEELTKSVSGDDLLTLIYTSGTTGMPKGVMLSHSNIMSNISAVSTLQKNLHNESFLSFLPLSHVLERMAGHFFPMAIQSKIFYAENMETVGVNMAEVSPTIVTCVPRFFEKMYDKIISGLNDGSDSKRKIFNWAVNIGKDHTSLVHAKQSIPFLLKFKHKVADIVIYSKVRQKLGGKIKFFISGGAPLSSRTAEFFSGIGLTILEGYGLTETSPVLTSNTPENIRFGSVGTKINNVEIKIAEDGEILAKGPNIMLGYYNNSEATKSVFNKDGWFKTGDIGEFDKDGHLKITDRKKSLIVTSAGKNIAPAPLENALTTSKYIDQALVLGDQRNFISALLVPNYENLNNFLASNANDRLSNEALADFPDAIELIQKEVDNSMKSFSHFEKIKKFKLLSSQFSIEKGEMTPKMSIVRKKVIENNNDLIESIYN